MLNRTLDVSFWLLFWSLSLQCSHADTIKVLEWNISGSEVHGNLANQNEAATVFESENADIIALQETGRGADEIAAILAPNYDLVASIDGQEIWLINTGRFITENSGSWSGQCNGRSLDGAFASISDQNSNNKTVHIYSAHFCIPDTFAGSVDTDPAVSNEDQQEHICNIIADMESNADSDTVILAADFNDINIPAGESIINFLQGSGTLNGGFCFETNIKLTEVVKTDVTHIMASAAQQQFSETKSVRPTFGQHGYVVATIGLEATVGESEPGVGLTLRTDGVASTAIITGRVAIEGEDTPVDSVRDTDVVTISGSITPEQAHLNKLGDLYIVILYEGDFYYKSSTDSFVSWDGQLSSLGAWRKKFILQERISLQVFTGQLSNLRGTMDIYFAYAYQTFFYYGLAPASFNIVET